MEFRMTRRKCLMVFLVGLLLASAGCSSAGAAVSGAVYEDSHCVVSDIELETGDEGDFYLHGSVKSKEDVEDSFNGTVTLLDDEGEGVGMAYFSPATMFQPMGRRDSKRKSMERGTLRQLLPIRSTPFVPQLAKGMTRAAPITSFCSRR